MTCMRKSTSTAGKFSHAYTGVSDKGGVGKRNMTVMRGVAKPKRKNADTVIPSDGLG